MCTLSESFQTGESFIERIIEYQMSGAIFSYRSLLRAPVIQTDMKTFVIWQNQAVIVSVQQTSRQRPPLLWSVWFNEGNFLHLKILYCLQNRHHCLGPCSSLTFSDRLYCTVNTSSPRILVDIFIHHGTFLRHFLKIITNRVLSCIFMRGYFLWHSVET